MHDSNCSNFHGYIFIARKVQFPKEMCLLPLHLIPTFTWSQCLTIYASMPTSKCSDIPLPTPPHKTFSNLTYGPFRVRLTCAFNKYFLFINSPCDNVVSVLTPKQFHCMDLEFNHEFSVRALFSIVYFITCVPSGRRASTSRRT